MNDIFRHCAVVAAAGLLAAIAVFPAVAAEKRIKTPTVVESEAGEKTLLLPADIEDALSSEVPGYRLPKESEFNPEMLRFFYSGLIGIHPAVASGDFNKDKKKDYALIVITGETKWGPIAELIILNGARRGYDTFRLGEVNNFKDDYVRFEDGKLTKGKYLKSAWYLTWDPKKNSYTKIKS